MAAQLREICAILSGLVIAADYNQGQVMIKDKNFVDNEAFFQKVFGKHHIKCYYTITINRFKVIPRSCNGCCKNYIYD